MRTGYRKTAYATYPPECALCGCEQRLEVHHKDENRNNNEVGNLQILCKPCHRNQHLMYPGQPMVIRNYQIPLSLKRWIEEKARERNVSAAEIVREILEAARGELESVPA